MATEKTKWEEDMTKERKEAEKKLEEKMKKEGEDEKVKAVETTRTELAKGKCVCVNVCLCVLVFDSKYVCVWACICNLRTCMFVYECLLLYCLCQKYSETWGQRMVTKSSSF